MAFSSWFPGLRKKEKIAYSSVEVDASKSNTGVLHQAGTSVIAGWPTGPQRIASAPLWLVADLLLLLMPVAFLTLAALAYKLDGKEISDRGRKIQEATFLGPTVFPLAFAALCGRSLKKFALWRAQEGTSLGFLEHIIGSQSLVATVGHAIALHSFNFLTLGLVILWAMSPLGGQSALRLVHETDTTVLDNRSVFYANVDASSGLTMGGLGIDDFNRVNAVVLTTLMTADTLEWTPVDIWNHPKIPRLEELENAENKNDSNRMWYNLDRHANHSYAALTGVGSVNLFQSGDTNFTIPYEYMYFGCELSPANNITTISAKENGYHPQTSSDSVAQLKYLRSLYAARALESAAQFPPKDNTSIAPAMVLNSNTQRDFFFYFKRNITSGQVSSPGTLLFGSRSSSGPYYLFECSMKSVMVEANIICEAESCWVERLRRLSIARSKRNGEDLPYDVVNDPYYTIRYFIQYLAFIGGETSSFQANPIDAYIFGNRPWALPSTFSGLLDPQKNWTEYIDDHQRTVDMSHRLTRFLNTYWDASRWPLAMSRNDPWGKISVNQTSGEPFDEMTMNKTNATVTRRVPVYRANNGWVAGLIICSSVQLLLGTFTLFLSLRITVPDIFDYVSSFTRDNPYINAPHGGSSLGGAKRARLLRKLPVQLGDTDACAEIGYIAMRSVDGAKDCEQGRVRKDRMYR